MAHGQVEPPPTTPADSLLHAPEIPPIGGQTSVCNMYLALDTSPRDLRQCVEGLQSKHDSNTDSAGYVRTKFINCEVKALAIFLTPFTPLIAMPPLRSRC